MKWFVVVDYIHGIKCVGINDEDYFGDGEIISTHAIVDEAEAAACAYAKENNLPLFEDIYVLDPSSRYNHGCTAYAVFQGKGDGTAVCIKAESCNHCWQVGHDDNFIYAQVGDVISMENLLQKSDLVQQDTIIKCVADLAKEIGVDVEGIKKAIYKNTDCGAWIEFENDCIKMGSIVEGVDECTETHILEYPFSANVFWSALQSIEDQANEIWNNTHGCPYCGTGIREKVSDKECEEALDSMSEYISVDPECKVCNGKGIVI